MDFMELSMREIKFRVWDEKRKDMVSWEELVAAKEELVFSWMSMQDENTKNIIEQFTGLHDKNGKEIYEGDIVSHNGLVRKNELLIIDFKDGAFCLTAQNKKIGEDVSCTIRDLMFQAKKCKMNLELIIFGNIHENPELLK